MYEAKAGGVLFAFLINAHSVAVAADIGAAGGLPWTTAHYHELARGFESKSVAADFIYGAIHNAGKDKLFDMESNKPNIVDYKFFDMHGDGKLQLLCRLDFSGRGMSLYLTAISANSDGYQVAVLDSGGVPLGKLSRIVQDVNHDGRKEVLVDRPLEWGADRSKPRPYFTDIYIYQANRFMRDNAQFRRYYKDSLLLELEATLTKDGANLNATRGKDSDAMKTHSEEVQADKKSIAAIHQFLLN